MLMILITLSLAAILVAWTGTSYGAFTGGSQLYFAQREQAMQERLVIEQAFFNKTGTYHTLMVFVRNVGLQQITIETIYVNGTSLTSAALSCLYGCSAQVTPGYTGYCSLPVTLAIGAVCEFFIGPSGTGYTPTGDAVACTGLSSGQWCSDTLFNFVVTTARGNQVTYSARGP
jgi:hypothetical protein